jgi:type I restriction enzyme S subunit
MKEDTVLSLSFGRIVIKPKDKLRGLVPASFETYQLVEPGDIIIRGTDLQNDKNSLRVGIARDRGIITSAYLCIQTKEKLTSAYGYLFMRAWDITKAIYGYGSGLRQNLDFVHFKRMPVLVPPLADQLAIERYISDIDNQVRRFIRNRQKLINLLNEQKQAIITQAVTRGLDPNVPLKPSGIEWIGDIPRHWEVRQIGHFAKVGNGSTPSRSNLSYWSGGHYPWLNSSSVNAGTIVSASRYVTTLALKECHLPRVKKGSVLVAITGQGKTRGTSAVLAIEATINQHVAYLTPRDHESRVTSDYLRSFLSSAYLELRRISDDSGSTKGALTCGDLRHFKVVLPPREEQEMIVSKIQMGTLDLENKINNIKQEISLILEYRTRLIADLVTGKLDVRQAALQLEDVVAVEIDDQPIYEEFDHESMVEEDDELESAEEVAYVDD